MISGARAWWGRGSVIDAVLPGDGADAFDHVLWWADSYPAVVVLHGVVFWPIAAEPSCEAAWQILVPSGAVNADVRQPSWHDALDDSPVLQDDEYLSVI